MKKHMRNFEKVVSQNNVIDELELPSLKPSDDVRSDSDCVTNKVDESYQLSQKEKNLFCSHLTALTKMELDLVSMSKKLRLAQAFFYSLYEETNDERFREVHDRLRLETWVLDSEVSKLKDNWTNNMVSLYFHYVRGIW